MTSPSEILDLHAELAVVAFEGAFVQVRGAARFLELHELEFAVQAVERAMPFWAAALDEMRTIRAAVRGDALTTEAAVEWRAQRDQRQKPASGREVSKPAVLA